jgi:hypothetical protein
MTIKVETSITIELEQEGETIVLVLTVEEARALKDELIRAVGARPDPPRGPLAPVINITPPKNTGFLNTDVIAERRLEQKIPEHLLKRAEARREALESRKCSCGESGWGQNGCCGVSGCNNVPG